MAKNKGGRPPIAPRRHTINVKLVLGEGVDDDLLAWFGALPAGQRAQRVKGALRQGGASLTRPQDPALADLIDDETLEALLDAL